MGRRQWSEMSRASRRLVILAAGAEGVLKVGALIDIARRPAAEIRGSKARWALAVAVVNSMGAVPIAYFAFGRRRPG